MKKAGDEGGGEPSDDQSNISDEETESKIESILKTNHVSLLMEHDKFVDEAQVSSTGDLSSPSPFARLINLPHAPHPSTPAFDYIRTFISTALGYTSPPTDAAEVSRARQSLSDTEATLREAEDKLKNARGDLEDLFKPERFGKDGEWKKLDRLCLEKDTGEYVLRITLRGMVSYPPLGTRTRFASLGKRNKGQMSAVLFSPSVTSLPGRRMRRLVHQVTIPVRYLLVAPSAGMVHSGMFRCVLVIQILVLVFMYL